MFLRHLVFSVLALFVIVSLTFFLRQMVGLQPMAPPTVVTGRIPWGDVFSAYLTYLDHVAHLDFGRSGAYPFGPVGILLRNTVPWTVLLVGTGIAVSLTLGTALGIVLAWHRGSLLDSLLTPSVIFISSIPYYFIAVILVMVLGVILGWFPVGNTYNPDYTPHLSASFVADVAQHLTLPATAVVLATFGLWVLPARNAMVAVLDDDFMALGKAKGLRRLRLMVGYAARNALLPIVTNIAIQLGYVLGGAVFVEFIFNYPGAGWLLVTSIDAHDYATVQALIILMAAAVLATNLIAQALYPLLDPRVR